MEIIQLWIAGFNMLLNIDTKLKLEQVMPKW